MRAFSPLAPVRDSPYLPPRTGRDCPDVPGALPSYIRNDKGRTWLLEGHHHETGTCDYSAVRRRGRYDGLRRGQRTEPGGCTKRATGRTHDG
jgi:hypothetical protein